MNDVVICLFASAGFDKAAQGLAGAGRRLAGAAAAAEAWIRSGAASSLHTDAVLLVSEA